MQETVTKGSKKNPITVAKYSLAELLAEPGQPDATTGKRYRSIDDVPIRE